MGCRRSQFEFPASPIKKERKNVASYLIWNWTICPSSAVLSTLAGSSSPGFQAKIYQEKQELQLNNKNSNLFYVFSGKSNTEESIISGKAALRKMCNVLGKTAHETVSIRRNFAQNANEFSLFFCFFNAN